MESSMKINAAHMALKCIEQEQTKPKKTTCDSWPIYSWPIFQKIQWHFIAQLLDRKILGSLSVLPSVWIQN